VTGKVYTFNSTF